MATGTRADIEIDRLAARRHGVVRRDDLRRRGVSDHAIRHRIAYGRLERVSRHVFRSTAVPVTPHQTILAACWSAGPGAVASHRSAALLHRIEGVRADAVEITVPKGRPRDVDDVVVHRSSHLEDRDVTTIGGIPCTTLVRTVMDLAAVLTPEELEEVVDRLERTRRLTLTQLQRILGARRRCGRNGVRTLELVLRRRNAGEPVPESVLERRFLRLVERAGLPAPLRQVVVRRSDGRRARLDFAYVDRRLGIELDGAVAHAGARQRGADARRGNAVQLADWHLLVFTWEDVQHRPGYVIATVRAALTEAAA